MRLALSLLVITTMMGCGPKTPGDDSEGGDTSSDPGGSTSAAGTTSGAPMNTDASTTADPTTTDPTTADPTTGPAAMCPAASVPKVTFTVSELAKDFQGHAEGDCVVASFSPGDVSDAVTLTCDLGSGPIDVTVSYGNAVVLLPAALQVVNAPMRLAYVRAAYEYRGDWVAIHDDADRLVLGLASGNSAIPWVDGQIEDLYAPVSVVQQGGFCPKGAGSCQTLGEPAVLRFSTSGDTLDLFPMQGGTLGPFTIHGGASWLADPDGGNMCDGSVDTWAAFVIGRP